MKAMRFGSGLIEEEIAKEISLEIEEEFKKALESRHDEESEDDCAMRIDLALSMVKPLTPESIDANNVDLAIDILKEARSILCTNGWADMDNINYKSNDAQTLKEEIDEYIKKLEEQKEQQQQQQQDPNNDSGGGDGGGGDSQTDPDDGGDDENNSDPNEDILDELDDLMQEGQYDRSNLDEEKEMFSGNASMICFITSGGTISVFNTCATMAFPSATVVPCWKIRLREVTSV